MDFAALMADEVARHRPRADYAQWDNWALVFYFVAIRDAARRLVIRIIHRPDADWRSIFKRASMMVDRLGPGTLADLHPACPDEAVLRSLVWLRAELAYPAAEIARRLATCEVGLCLVLAREATASVEVVASVLRALRAERVTSYRPDEEPHEDLRQFILAKAYEYQDEAAAAVVGTPLLDGLMIPLPRVPGLAAEDPEPWRTLNPRLLVLELDGAWRILLPALQGRTGRIRGQVRQALRDHWRARKAQKRAATVVSLDDVTRESAAEGALPEGPNQRALRAYQEARRRWGPKAARFLDALAKGATVTEAARAAGISRKTGHKYLAELRKDPRLRDPA